MTDLESALDGLQTAENYCEANGMMELGQGIADLYQAVAIEAPEGDWDE